MVESGKSSSAAINPFEVALTQLDEAAKIIKLDSGLHKVLASPKRVLTVSIPVKMDDGRIEVRILHDGPLTLDPPGLTIDAGDIFAGL